MSQSNSDIPPDIQGYLRGINFPAGREEVASTVESNGALPDTIYKIRNATADRFNSPEEILQVLRSSPNLRYNRDDYHG